MRDIGTMIWRGIAQAVLVALAWASPCAFAMVPPHWKEVGYSYNAQHSPLPKVLADFAQSQGVELKVSGNFSQVLSGRIQGTTAVEFLDRLAILHRFQWFVYNTTLYISPAVDSAFERIELPTDEIGEFKGALTGLGLFEPKFGWGELPEQHMIAVTGPPVYIRLIRQVLQSSDTYKRDSEAMVFRLKYAAVNDREVMIRDKVTVTPGVATILKKMLAGREPRGNGSPSADTPMADANPITPMPSAPTNALSPLGQLPFLGMSNPSSPTVDASRRGNPVDNRRSSGGGAASVEGDIRTNSVVIWDSPSKRSYYQRLVDALDIPQQMVEIEAMIVDISQERLKEIGIGLLVGSGRRSVGLNLAGALAPDALSGSTIVLQSLDKFFAQLRLLESTGDAHILAKPSVMTLENLVAVLDLSQTVFMKATGERVAQVTPVTAGTMLRVTPRVIEESGGLRIHLAVDIEDGKIISTLGADTPEVQRSTVSTQAVLANQESLIIGGYNSDQSGKKDAGIPGLSKVPVLGSLFSSNQVTSQSRQRLFIITPRLVGAEQTSIVPDITLQRTSATPAGVTNEETLPADLIRLK